MIAALPAIANHQPNPDWASLPLFRREDWTRMPFGNFAESVNVRVEPADAAEEVYVGLDDLDSGCLHIRRWGKGSDVIGTKLRFRKGDLIFGRRRAYQRKLAVAAMEGICSAHAMVVRAKPDVVRPEFLPFLMMSDKFMRRAVEISVGSLSPTINWTTLKHEEFDVPPLDQQRRIAEILWAVDECRVNGESLLSSLEAVHKATRDAGCDVDSETKRFAQVITYASDGPFGSKLKTEHYANCGARVIRLQNVGDGVFDDSDQVFISKAYFDELKRYEVRAGDVIIAGLGDETHPVGRAALIPRTLGPAVNKADCFCVRADPTVVSNAYLTYFLNSRNGCAQVAARAQGTTRMRINVGNLKTVMVPVPSPAAQKQLVMQLETIEAGTARISESLTATQETMTAFLTTFFGA